MEEKILITGANGRVGKHLVDALVNKGEKVRALVKEGNIENEQVEIFYGDMLNKESLKKAVEGVDVIYHLAAVVDYLAPKDLMFNVNVIGTKNLLEVAKLKKFIYMSSTAVMGKKLKENPATEKTPCHPSDFYGQTKFEAEKLVKEAGGIIIRSADIYGPGFEEGYFSVFGMLDKGKMKVFGDGKNVIQYIHIDELVQALMLAKENGKQGEIYIVTGKDMKTQRELYQIICKLLGVDFNEKHMSPMLAKATLGLNAFSSKLKGRKPKFISEYVKKLSANRTFDTTKAKNELGFQPHIEYESGLAVMIEEYKKIREDNMKQEQEDKPKEQSNQQQENVSPEQSKDKS